MNDVAGLGTTAYGEQGSRVVFLHGLFGQGRNWTQVAKALAPRHRVVLVDLPDHGRSAWTEGFDPLEVADTVAGLLDPADPAALVGHSLGGKVAMALALRHPEVVERLCVVDISPVDYAGLSEFAGYVEAMKGLDLSALTRRSEADEALAAEVPDTAVRAFLLQNLRRETAPDGSTRWRWQHNLDGLGRDLPVIKGWPEDELAGTPAYEGKVLWLAGETSRYVTEEHEPAMERWFPRHRRVTVKNAGHWVHSQQPEVFLEVLRRFLEDG